MKTVKRIFGIIVLTFCVSCGTYYKMVTTIARDGSAQREVYAWGDSAFLAGDLSRNPFMFDLTQDWHISPLDSAMANDFFGTPKSLNIRISKHTNSIENFSKELQYNVEKQSLVAPEESLVIKKGWFYTNYSLKVVYKKFQYEVPISIDDYLSREEQIVWTQGNFSQCKLYNGSEMSDYLDNINEKFMKWYVHNCFEVSFQLIKKYSDKQDLNADKENIFKELKDNMKSEDEFGINPEAVCNFLDYFYRTTYFSKLNKIHSEELNKEYNNVFAPAELIGNVISYEIILPGELVEVSFSSYQSGTIFWKIDGMRLLFDDLTFTAQSRIKNRWALMVTGLLLIVVIGSTVLIVKNRKKKI
ncbi:MAG: hypothetical protein LBI45_00560 [Bacteroidales bacterium]|jgi:ribosomal protein S26|nr:hypothetical protein [Bacteroidales bacterium]